MSYKICNVAISCVEITAGEGFLLRCNNNVIFLIPNYPPSTRTCFPSSVKDNDDLSQMVLFNNREILINDNHFSSKNGSLMGLSPLVIS